MSRIPLKDFFRNPEKTGYSISPKGGFLSYLAPYHQRLNIFIQKMGSGESQRITSVEDRDIRNYFWANEETILFLKDFGGDENFHLYSVNHQGELKDLTPFDNVKVDIIDELVDRDNEILIMMNKRNPQLFDVFRLFIDSGELVEVARNPGNITGWLSDHDGKIRGAFTTDGVNQSLLYRGEESDAFRVVLKTNFKESVVPQLFSFDNQKLICLSNLDRDKLALVEIDPKTGKEDDLLYINDEVDLAGVAFSRERKVLTSCHYISWKLNRHFFDKETEEMFHFLESELGKQNDLYITAYTRDEQQFIVRTLSDRSMGAYYLYNKEKGSLRLLAKIGSWLPENELAEMKPIQFESRDGLLINGYLTLPNAGDGKKMPVVVNPHGGPWHRDVWGFNPEVQFLANRGFAILQINFRGSTGYGKQFWQSSFKQWGKTMQNDISDGVQWLIDTGIGDPSRIAIYGGSYGGYATLAGLAFTPELYACGVDYVGVSNLFTFLNTIPPYWKPYLDMMHEMVGHPEKDKELLTSSSPVFHANQISAPLFVAQGANDPRVAKDESDQIVEALKRNEVAVKYMVKDNEGHGFQNEENRLEFYEAMEEFFVKFLVSSNNNNRHN